MDAVPLIEPSALVRAITDLGAPVVVGISGFGGSGKSTLATWLTQNVPGCVRVRGDDFLDPTLSQRRSNDWNGVDRARLTREVLDPFRRGERGQHRPYDWSQRRLADAVPNPEGSVLVVDLVGLFHPEVINRFDIRVWIDLDLATATERGLARDAAMGRDHRDLWRTVWVPNEEDFERSFSPRETATHLLRDEPGRPLAAALD
jgi:uridine kinase